MALPPFAMHSPPPPPGLLFPNMFPPLPPPPPPPPNYLLRNLRNNGFAFPVLPRIPRAQHSCRPKKIINICDPQTGQDITEEILSSVNKKNAPDKSYPLKKVSPPFRPHRRPPLPVSSPLPIPLGFIRKTPPPPPLIMKCVPDPEFLWPEDDIRWRNPNGLSPFFGSCSWPPNSANLPDEDGAIREPRKRYQSVSVNKKNIVNYNRDVLLSLRYHPLALEKPAGLPDLDVIKKEVKQPEKTSEKVCDNGAQTVLARSAFKSQSKNAIGFKKGYSNHKLKPSTLKKDNISGEEMKSKALKSPVTLDRGDGKEVGEVNNLIEKISNLAIG